MLFRKWVKIKSTLTGEAKWVVLNRYNFPVHFAEPAPKKDWGDEPERAKTAPWGKENLK